MNILEIVSGADINGAVVHCALLSRELARRGHEVTVLCRSGAKVTQLLAGEHVRIVESDMHRFPLDEVKRAAEVARDAGVEVLHTHMTRAHNFGVLLGRFARVPCVATAHSHIVQPMTWMFNDYVIAVSDATRRFQLRHNFVRSERIETVYGFTDYDRVTSVSESARAMVRKELGLSDTVPVIGIVGDIIPRKGHLYLVRALADIVRVVPDARLLIVGGPKRKIGQQYFDRLRAESARLGLDGSLIWAGYRNDVLSIVRALDAYVLASLDEMFPVAVLEAMAARRPIVATNVGGVPECLTDEESALLVPPADPAALAHAIRRLLTDGTLAARLGDNAHDRARDQFSLASQTPRIEAVFRQVIERCKASTGPSRPAVRRP